MELLQFAIDSGTIDITKLQAEYDMNERKKYLELHTNKVWQGKNGKWYTYFTDEERGRVQKVRNTEKELLDLIVSFYKENRTIQDVFTAWMDEKIRYNEIQPQTVTRYRNEYKRFFVNNQNAEIIKTKQFKNISENDLKVFIKSTIADMELTRKTYSGLRLLINSIFIYGKDMGYTNISITQFMGDLRLSSSIFKKKIKDKESEVYSSDELEYITGNLRTRTEDIRALGLLLTFETGLRISELSGMKKCDVKGKTLHICRTEVTYRENGKNVCIVQDYPKSSAGDRYIILTELANKTIDMIFELSDDSEFLFSIDHKRIRSNAFRRKLMRVCNELEIPYKSNHKIRKTYGTLLIDANVDDGIVADQMGHSDITTTKKYYYYSNKNEKQKREQVNKALFAI